MGFYDSVTVERGHEDIGIRPSSTLQTKNFCQISSEFVLTSEGELIEELCRYEEVSAAMPRLQRIPTGRRTLRYHGDILLYGDLREFVARFTHGRLEWIRPAEDYPDENRQILIEQGGR